MSPKFVRYYSYIESRKSYLAPLPPPPPFNQHTALPIGPVLRIQRGHSQWSQEPGGNRGESRPGQLGGHQACQFTISGSFQTNQSINIYKLRRFIYQSRDDIYDQKRYFTNSHQCQIQIRASLRSANFSVSRSYFFFVYFPL